MKTIHTGMLGPLIHEAFRGDWPLINTYHLVNGSLAGCVKSTFQQIMQVADSGEPLEYWGIYHQEEPIGFTVTGKNFLLSFGIAVRWRTREVVMSWWSSVCQHLEHEFATWLFNKNVRAIDFVKRQGMEVVESNDLYVTLLLKKTELCQQVAS